MTSSIFSFVFVDLNLGACEECLFGMVWHVMSRHTMACHGTARHVVTLQGIAQAKGNAKETLLKIKLFVMCTNVHIVKYRLNKATTQRTSSSVVHSYYLYYCNHFVGTWFLTKSMVIFSLALSFLHLRPAFAAFFVLRWRWWLPHHHFDSDCFATSSHAYN